MIFCIFGPWQLYNLKSHDAKCKYLGTNAVECSRLVGSPWVGSNGTVAPCHRRVTATPAEVMAVGVSVPGSRPNCLPSPRALSSVTSVCFTTRLINWNVSLRIEFGSIRSSPIVSAAQCAENAARHSCRFPIFPPHQAGRKLNKLYIIVACRAGPCARAVLLFVWNLQCVCDCARPACATNSY